MAWDIFWRMKSPPPPAAPAPTRFTGTDSYIATPDLMVAVNAAITLTRPLLIKGEPGTGKTILAQEVARALDRPLLRWHIKSTTKAQQGLYEYDAVARLRGSQLGDARVHDTRTYLLRGSPGEAFPPETQTVLLTDEIDKADIEFPNDLLLELDRMEFYVYETRETIVAKQRPIVIITSNNEKELPGAFLRRCVFHFIDFPTTDLLRRIVEVHHPGLERALVDQVTNVFFDLRNMQRISKRPSTSELIDWIAVLRRAGIREVKLEQNLPFLGALLKKEQDLATFADQVAGGRKYRS